MKILLPTLTTALIVVLLAPLLTLAPRKIDPKPNKMTRRDHALAWALALLYGVCAFIGLGDAAFPRTYASPESAVIALEDDCDVSRALLCSGVVTGGVTVEFSADGESFYPAADFTQDYVALLKWHELDITPTETPIRLVRVSATGGADIQELALFNSYGDRIPISCAACPELCDEQDAVPASSNYMNSSYFDEIYHARTAVEQLRGIDPYEKSHPPLGKLLISLGIWLLGLSPFGWRFMGALVGALMLPPLYALLKKITGRTATAFCAAAVFAFDFMHFTQTRIATIDTYAVFFTILMYLFMYLYLTDGHLRDLALSGLCFGLGAASKWTCLYAGAGLAVLWLGHWVLRLHRERAWRAFAKNVGFCLLFFVAVPAAIYYLSYFPYTDASPLSREYFDIVVENQRFMYTYHAGVNAEHPYSSRWYEWVLNVRPILYYLEYFPDGSRSSFGAFLSPTLCWGGLLALCYTAYCAIVTRERAAVFIVVGYLAQLVPWMFVTRITFNYHYFPSSVFLALALGYSFERMFAWRPKTARRLLLTFTALSIALFALFYPVLSGASVPASATSGLYHWLPGWPF